MALGRCILKSVLFGLGSVFLCIGVLMAVLWPFLMNNVFKAVLPLTKGSRSYDMWEQTPLPMYMDIYLFNWTNHEDVIKHGAKPIVQQVGPFVFSEQHTKVNVKWNNNNTVTYQQYRKWIYHPELSNGSLSDNITTVNVISVTVGQMGKQLGPIERFMLNSFLNVEEKLVVTKNVSQFLFNGYSDQILKIMEILGKKFKMPLDFDKFGWFYKRIRPLLIFQDYTDELVNTLEAIEHAISVMPEKFGWFYQRNMSETVDGVFNMETGINDMSHLGDVITWNGKSRQQFYSGDCAAVKGSLGELWPPSSAKKDFIDLYAFDICGHLRLTSSSSIDVHGLNGVVFSGGRDVFDNGTSYPESACYCVRGKTCPPSGVRDISQCRNNAPVFVSFPHFYLADHYYTDAVEGLHPDPEKHAFTIALEENTAIPLQVSGRLQINLLIEEISDMSFFKGLPHVYLPMIWFDQHTKITESMAETIKPLSELKTFGLWVLIGIAILGGLLITVGIVLKLNGWCTNDDSDREILTNEPVLSDRH